MSAQFAQLTSAATQPATAAGLRCPSLTGQRSTRRVEFEPKYGGGRGGVEVSYLWHGAPDAPTVIVQGGISASRDVLTGGQRVLLREDARPVRSARRRRDSQIVTGASIGIEAYEQPLWDALRATRSQLAKQHGVPPYVVFHDATLLAMLRAMPADETELASISGVGEAKLKRYGRDFLAVINAAE